MSRYNRRNFRREGKKEVSNESSFYAPLTHSLLLTNGQGSATFTRASSATVEDFEGLIKTAKASEARFKNARRVENLLTAAEAFSSAAWIKNAGGTGSVPVVTVNDAIAPNQTLTADKVVFNLNGGTSTNDISSIYQNIADVAGNSRVTSIYIKLDAGVTARLAYGSGAINVAGTGNWQRVSFISTVALNATFSFFVLLRGGLGTSNSATVYLWGAMLENVTSQSNQNPSEYVSNGVLPAPYHGAGVDGVEWFDTYNGNTVVGNVVTEAEGAAIPASTLKGIMTNALDVIRIPTTTILNNSAGTLLFSATPLVNIPNNATAGDGKQWLLDLGSATGLFIESQTLKLFDGTNTVTLAFIPLADITYKGALSYGSAGLKVYLNGVSAAGSFDGSMNLGTNLTIGGSSTGTTMNWKGTIKNLQGWKRQLTDSQIVALQKDYLMDENDGYLTDENNDRIWSF